MSLTYSFTKRYRVNWTIVLFSPVSENKLTLNASLQLIAANQPNTRKVKNTSFAHSFQLQPTLL